MPHTIVITCLKLIGTVQQKHVITHYLVHVYECTMCNSVVVAMNQSIHISRCSDEHVVVVAIERRAHQCVGECERRSRGPGGRYL